MLNISAESKLKPEQIKQKFRDFFGDNGLKLELSEELEDCLTYTGGGGFITITILPGEKKNKIDIVTREWEYQAKDFLSGL